MHFITGNGFYTFFSICSILNILLSVIILSLCISFNVFYSLHLILCISFLLIYLILFILIFILINILYSVRFVLGIHSVYLFLSILSYSCFKRSACKVWRWLCRHKQWKISTRGDGGQAAKRPKSFIIFYLSSYR